MNAWDKTQTGFGLPRDHWGRVIVAELGPARAREEGGLVTDTQAAELAAWFELEGESGADGAEA